MMQPNQNQTSHYHLSMDKCKLGRIGCLTGGFHNIGMMIKIASGVQSNLANQDLGGQWHLYKVVGYLLGYVGSSKYRVAFRGHAPKSKYALTG